MVRNRKNINNFALALSFAAFFAGGVTAQVSPPLPKVEPKPPVRIIVAAPRPPAAYVNERTTNERSIAVSPNVSIKLPCVSDGDVRVNGWDREEVRVFVKNGRNFAFKVQQKDPASGKPVWILISAANPSNQPGQRPDCISGESIEIDAPRGASLDLTGRVADTTIDSLKKVKVTSIEGSISLRNISGGIVAATFQGDVTVENSGGEISLESSTGNVAAFQVVPGQIGDLFRAKTTNGSISLQNVEHPQIEAGSISGSVAFDGKFLDGGLYTFKTLNGAVRLTIPTDSSCRVVASYGFGNFNSAFPMKTITENEVPGGKRLVADIGTGGDATVNVTTNSGSIAIKKQ